ncbi:MAG: M20/M25/M40 family metallo-hydrolase [Pyrinomonadaceae bacterium]
MKKNLIATLTIFAFVISSFSQATVVRITPAEKKIAEGVTAKQLSDYLYFVASDEMEGRDTPSRGLDTTAKFIGMNLSRWGFKPAGDNGTFYQKMPMTRESLDTAATTLEIGAQSFVLNEDFYRVSGTGTASGALVFGRDGWMVKSKGIDAFAGVDVKGKIVVLSSPGFSQSTLIPRPTGVTDDDLKGEEGVDWANPLEYVRRKGAAAVIVVAPPQLQANWGRLRNFLGRGSLYVDKLRNPSAQASGPSVPAFLVSEKVASAIFAGEAADKSSAIAFETKKNAKASSATKVEKLMTQNVVAVWEGSDPVLKQELVAIGAHYDHVGVNPNAPGADKIFNGADDDGSGTVAVLAIAEALAKAPKRPKRSVLFVWHAGEEKGLWGSEYFNKFPTVDIKQVIAALNIDMIGRSQDPNKIIKCDPSGKPCNEELSKANEIYVIGKDMMSSTMGVIVDGANKGYLKLAYNTKYDDPKDPNRFFFRSDHFNYALNGIPIAFWFDGEHEDYHGAGDHADKIDYAKMEKVTRTILLTLWELTDLKARPKVDKTLPKELTQR